VVDCSIVQEGQVSHVIAHFILWRIHLKQLVSLESDGLALSGHEGDIIAVIASDLGALVALFLAGHEEVLGGTVGHGCKPDFLSLGYQQVLQGLNNFWIVHVNHFRCGCCCRWLVSFVF